MTTAPADAPLTHTEVPRDLLEAVAERASAIDAGEALAREFLPELGRHGLNDLGAPGNSGGDLLPQAAVIEQLAERSLSTGFALWGHRMAVEYFAAAGTPYAHSVLTGLREGTVPGVSGMASAFKTFAGAGTLDLTAVREGQELILNGRLPWASNLYPDAVVATSAWETAQGEKTPIVVSFPVDAQGVEIGRDLDLLALQGTSSTSVKLTDVRIPAEQVLSEDFYGFLARCRPTFAVLQSAFCLGLATASFRAARSNLPGLNEVFFEEFRTLQDELAEVKALLRDYALRVNTEHAPQRSEVLSLRLQAGQLAVALATLEIKTSGGKGYVVTSDANRRFREATFLPVQSPSEAQLRWELAHGR